MSDDILEVASGEIYRIRTRAAGPSGSLPVSADLLLNRPSRDLFGLTQNAGMGWAASEVFRKQFLILGGFGTTPKKVYSRLELSILRNLRFREDLLRTPSLSKKWGFIFLGNLSQSRTLFLN
jgi:hypothetical protein